MTETVVRVSPGTDRGIVGDRQLIAVQIFDISRLTTHPVLIRPGTFVAVSGVGPKGDSNGSGKTSFLSAISVLLADPQWNLEGNGGKSISGLLFRPAAAGLDSSQQDSAALHGYVVGVFAEPDHPEQTALTVWVRIATTSPYVQARWTAGLHVADADSDEERALQADLLWQALPREGTIGTKSMGQQLYGEAPRCLSYLDTPLRPSAPSLLSQEMTKMSPAEIGRALIALAGLTGQLDLEREQRNKTLEQRIRLRTAEEEARSARADEDVQLAAIHARDTARTLLDEARDTWRHYAARQYLDALAADRTATEAIAELAEDLTVREAEKAQAAAGLQGLGTREDIARRESEARIRSKAADALAQQLTNRRAVAADRAGALTEERNRLLPLRKRWKGQAPEESAAALEKAAKKHLTATADEEKAVAAVTEAEAALKRARAGRSGLAGRLVDRLHAEPGITEAVALADVVELDEAARLAWEPRLHGLREAVVVPRERLHEAQAVLADEPGAQLLAADPAAGIAAQASGDGIRYPAGLQHLMDGLARRFSYHPEPARAEDDALRATVLGNFPEPQVGREAGIRRAERDLRDAQAWHQTAVATVLTAKAERAIAKDEDDAAQAVRKLDGTDGTNGIEARLKEADESIAALDGSIGAAEAEQATARTALEEAFGLLTTYDTAVTQAKRLLKDAEGLESDVATRLSKAKEARTAIPIEAWSSEFGGTQQDAAQLCDAVPGVQAPRPATLLRQAAERLRDALAAFQRGSDQLSADFAIVEAEHAAFADQQPGGTPVPFAGAARPLLSRLQGAADHDRITAARIRDVRNEREQALGQLKIETGQKEQSLSLTQDMVESVIDLAIRKVSQTLNTMTTYGAALEVNSIRPDGAAAWEWEVTPKWKRSASGGLISYKESANSAQVKVFAIQLVLAALIADNQTAGRVVILDELGNSLGDVNRRDVLKSISDVAEQQQVTILGTCQDSILSDASDFFGELIWFTHAAASDAYNQPTRIWCHDPLGERVELTGRWLQAGRDHA